MRAFNLLLAVLLLPSESLAQDVSLGIKVGPNHSTQRTASCCGDTYPFDGLRGVVAGITGTVRFPSKLGVQVEALFAQKGIRASTGFWMRQDYLELPVLVRVHAFQHRSLNPVALVGLAPAVELGCRGRTTPYVLNGAGSVLLLPLDCGTVRRSRTDLGLVGAVGVDLHLGGATWTGEVRYVSGSRSLTRGWQYIPRTTNHSVALLVGVRRARP